jgi:hypothetical protein
MSLSPRRVATALWVALAIVTWNVIFDRVLVLAGRRYVYAAATAANVSRPYERIGDWMPPAAARAAWLASAGAAIVLAVGLGAIALASRRKRD